MNAWVPMESTWRWFGPSDPITLADVRQSGATGVVTALHEIPNGEVWPVEAIRDRQRTIADAGLTWSVVESVPVHEDIKQRCGNYQRYIANYAQTLRNLAECGLDTVCYNFMPVLDWTRTELARPLPDTTLALAFDLTALVAFDVFILRRPGAEAEHGDALVSRAAAYVEQLTASQREALTDTILAGLPGSEETYTLDSFRDALARYNDIDAPTLRRNLCDFVAAVVPVAAEVGVRLAIHPDDPPRSLFGLPRVVSSGDDLAALFAAVPEPANGLTLCVGSLGSSATNDVAALCERFRDRIYFAHLRNVLLDPDEPASFTEVAPFAGSADMLAVLRTLLAEQADRSMGGDQRRIPLRPDHGMVAADDLRRATNPGYSLIGRMRNLAEIHGAQAALIRQ